MATTNPNDSIEQVATPADKIEKFPDEPQEEVRTFEFVKETVSDQDIFKLAKTILLFVFIIFVIIAVLRMVLDENEGVIDVWEYSKVILNSISSLVLGLYFGKKK